MIFISDFEIITETKYFVKSVDYMPFDTIHGIDKSEDELKQIGVLIDEMPMLDCKEGVSPKLFLNPQTKQVWYEYSSAINIDHETNAQ